MDKTTEKRAFRQVSVLLTAILLTASLAGCGATGSAGYVTPAPAASPSQTPVEEDSTPEIPVDAGTEDESPADAEDDSEEADAEDDAAPTETAPVEEDSPDMASAEAVAYLGTLEGDMSFTYGSENIVSGINIDEDHNPYDLTWRYGVRREYYSRGSEWGNLYQSYVDACDWSLVFDAEYYMDTFPMLAELYQHNKDLLLEHYQTVGVHEGRQASAGFCPAVYAENCDPDLKALFGEDWECYTFYYMLNYDAEKSVDARNGGSDPTWLSIELSKTQSQELEHVNEYRAEVGADPVVPHPEMMALANFRAWTDAYNGIKAHDWLDTNTEDLYVYMEWMDMWKFNENTVKSWGAARPTLNVCWVNYRYSEEHYEAMVRASQKTFGTSNCYWSAHTEPVCCSFDVYTDAAVPVNTLKEK